MPLALLRSCQLVADRTLLARRGVHYFRPRGVPLGRNWLEPPGYPLRIDLGYGRHFYDIPTIQPSGLLIDAHHSSNPTANECTLGDDGMVETIIPAYVMRPIRITS